MPTIKQIKSLFGEIIVALGMKGRVNQESGTSMCYLPLARRVSLLHGTERRHIWRKIHLWFFLVNVEVAGLRSPPVSLETPRLPQKEHMEVELSWCSFPF